MFEKSLFDLIKGLRDHKGNERGYIQDSIRECRREIKSQDLDLKSIALLKLTYLEMFGHDMSWASFNVLEVMASQKFPQKRIAYLAAVQSFRSDTEVLMLVENQLKKDLGSPMAPTISLPLVAIPHVLNMSMANSLLGDLLPRLSHSNPIIRKKTIVTLYRLALVYPETLRPAWPKIKERLQDESEDPSVTAAVVNVVCELGWRRPHDFLPLAPRLFDLLVEGSNNWMAIKIIKLFATLTPLEPRLVKKLLAPLTTIIKTTPAMSLLYECINGIITSGILTSTSGSNEGDEVARLCVSKLRGMLTIEGDPNLRYVALLAFERIVELHPNLVSLHEDAILGCIDDVDISIRLRALDLAAGMVNAHNLTQIVERLTRQLEASASAVPSLSVEHDRGVHNGVEPYADSDDEGATQPIKPRETKSESDAQLPDEYKITVIQRVLSMCSRDNYAYIDDFDWYIGNLLALIQHIPPTSSSESGDDRKDDSDIALTIGNELRNVAIRVRSARAEAVHAAEKLLSTSHFRCLVEGNTRIAVAGPAAWVVGEFPSWLHDAEMCLDSLVRSNAQQFPPAILGTLIQASMKIFASIASDPVHDWNSEWKTIVSFLMAKMIKFLEGLTTHPDLNTQETSVEFLELLRLANEATKDHDVGHHGGEPQQGPLLLSQAIPSLFLGSELNPVAAEAQAKVPFPEEIALGDPINEHLDALLQVSDASQGTTEDAEFYEYYYKKPKPERNHVEPAASRLQVADEPISYQQASTNDTDVEKTARKRAERQSYLREDPFYISGRSSGSATPVHEILRATNGEELDVDSIPIMELDLGDEIEQRDHSKPTASLKSKHKNHRQKVKILSDETVDQLESTGRPSTVPNRSSSVAASSNPKKGGSFLQVDSSGLGSLSLGRESDHGGRQTQLELEKWQAEEAEMTQAMKEVERLRLEMQRAQERIEAKSETTVVKRRKKKKVAVGEGREATAEYADHHHSDDPDGSAEMGGAAQNKHKSKKTHKTMTSDTVPNAAELEAGDPEKPRKKKKKKRRQADLEDPIAG